MVYIFFLSGLQPVPSVSRDEVVGDEIEYEMESLFGDVSDQDDPTYVPSPRHHMDQDEDLITLQDLLEDNLQPVDEEVPKDFMEDYVQPNNDGMDGLSEQENEIETLREENRKQKKTATFANSILEIILKKMWKQIKPIKKFIRLKKKAP